MNKKGFTLIELLAVIIILGILMIIAIPSVTKYISDSRKSSYIDTAKEVIGAARNLVNSGELEMYDTNTTYYIDVKCINTENALKSPYGEFVDEGAYVVVTYDGKGYDYYWTSVDESGQGVKNIVRIDKLDVDDIESDIKKNEIITTGGIDDRENVIKIEKSNNCTKGVSEEASIIIDGNTGKEMVLTAARYIKKNITLEDVAGAKRYTGGSPNNYVYFNGNEKWRIIGVYGDKLKIIKAASINNAVRYGDSRVNAWEGSELEVFLNSTYYDSLTDEAKDMIVEGTWYVGATPYDVNASESYALAKELSWTGKVGLISAYEYLYSTPRSSWSKSGHSLQQGESWIFSGSNTYSFTLTPSKTSSSCVVYVYLNGPFHDWGFVMNPQGERPTVFLDSSVIITGGDGSASNPYTLSKSTN